jgi:hypothetical protein
MTYEKFWNVRVLMEQGALASLGAAVIGVVVVPVPAYRIKLFVGGVVEHTGMGVAPTIAAAITKQRARRPTLIKVFFMINLSSD